MSQIKQSVLEEEYSYLESTLSGDMLADMKKRERMHKIKLEIATQGSNEPVLPRNPEVECVGCGS